MQDCLAKDFVVGLLSVGGIGDFGVCLCKDFVFCF